MDLCIYFKELMCKSCALGELTSQHAVLVLHDVDGHDER